MAAAKSAAVDPRLKREDRKRTKHDSQFSKWKFLIGPDDWEDHSAGKEGVSRYRLENLPKSSCSGLYELAIYPTGFSSRIDPVKVLVVYLGEADSVRTRLQQYGRTGAHLGRSCSGENGCGCFKDIFSRGYSILYRWAPMENKAEAYLTEAQLLKTFDYAWNKGSNGARRHDDILQKLDKGAPNSTLQAIFSSKLLHFRQKQVGIKIKASKLLSQDDDFSRNANAVTQVFKFSRSQLRLVLDRGGSNEDETVTCGVVSGDGSICRRPPVEGRKRCAEHKGKKTKGSSVGLNEKSQQHKASSEYIVSDNGGCDIYGAKIPSIATAPSLTAGNSPTIEQCSPVCGVAMEDGSICRRQPVSGRKRCNEHKGMKICSSNSRTTRHQTIPYVVLDSYADGASGFDNNIEILTPGKVETGAAVPGPVNEGCKSICGVELDDGHFCTKQPIKGRVRCEDHKGLRVTRSFLSGLDAKGTSPVSNWNYSSSAVPHRPVNEGCKSICGVELDYGHFCTKQPVKGRVRCEDHKGLRVTRSFLSGLDAKGTSPVSNWNYSSTDVSICGARTRNGSYCQRTVKGNGTCWQH